MSKRIVSTPDPKYGVGDLLAITYRPNALRRELVVISRITSTSYFVEFCDGRGTNALPHPRLDKIDGTGMLRVELVSRGQQK